MTVVAPGELHDLAATSRAAREADGAHGGFGAGVDETQLFHRGDPADDLLGQFGLGGTGSAVGQSAASGFPHCVDDLRMSMAEDRRPPGADEVDVVVAVGVD